MAPRTGTSEQYAVEMGELWTGLTRTLGRLDRLAAEPGQLEDASAEVSLRRLQYALHAASEHAYGVEPPDGAVSAHRELADALAGARDATAEVAEAVGDLGAAGVAPLLHVWRGALFRVRLARLHLAAPTSHAPDPDAAPDGVGRPLAAFLLALLGAVAFVAGATLALWPVWVLGLLAVCGSLLVFRP
jgi:hypothetical protein